MAVQFISAINVNPSNELNRLGLTHVDVPFFRRYVDALEDAQFDYTLVPYTSSWHDQFAISNQIVARSERVAPIVALRPNTLYPTVAARALATLDQFGNGRTAVHFISGGNDQEQAREGDYSTKAERYRRTAEYVEIVRKVWTSTEPFGHEGEFYKFDDHVSVVRPVNGTIPVSVGGSSQDAYRVGGSLADIFGLWGEPLKDTRDQIEAVHAEAAKAGRADRPRIWVTFRPIIAATEELAWEKAHRILGVLESGGGHKAWRHHLGSAGTTPPNVGSQRLAVVPRGAGTGLSAGALAVEGGLVLSTERMRDIEIDPKARVAIAEPGASTAEVKRAAAERGLWYPPDPASSEICSIGGNVATNAGGMCCVKYGVTADYVLGLDVVLADGSLLRLGGTTVKDVAGLSLVKLFVGSEGVLGVVTRVVLRLLPPQGARSTLAAAFPTVDAAARAVVEFTAGSRPALCELMDNATINAVEDFAPAGLDRTSGALLLVQSDAPGDAGEHEVAGIRAACLANGATQLHHTRDPEEAEKLLAARRPANPAVQARGTAISEDVVVPTYLLPTLLARVRRIAEETGVEIPVIAHAGDGNAHPKIVCREGQEAEASAAFRAVMAAAIELGGTITGEHGVGRLKRDALRDQLGPDVIALTRRIKDALDPAGILNPGAVL